MEQLKACKNIAKPADLIGKFKQSFTGVFMAMKSAAICCDLQDHSAVPMQNEFDTGVSLLDLLASEIGAARHSCTAGTDAKFIGD